MLRRQNTRGKQHQFTNPGALKTRLTTFAGLRLSWLISDEASEGYWWTMIRSSGVCYRKSTGPIPHPGMAYSWGSLYRKASHCFFSTSLCKSFTKGGKPLSLWFLFFSCQELFSCAARVTALEGWRMCCGRQCVIEGLWHNLCYIEVFDPLPLSSKTNPIPLKNG